MAMRLTATDLQAMGYAPDGTRIGKAGPKPTQAAERESDLHDEILAYCRARGWPVVHSRMDVPQTAGIGTPDFVIALPGGMTVWIEAKARKGKVSPEQAAWIAALRIHQHRAWVVRSFAEFLDVIK